MSISSKVTYITTVITAITMAIVLILLYSSIRLMIYQSTKKDLIESVRPWLVTPMGRMHNPKNDIYISKDGIVIVDPYEIGPINKIGKFEINGRTYLFLRAENLIVGKDITPIVNYLNNIKKIFVYIFAISLSLISFLTYFITKKSTKHLRNFVSELSKIKGDNLSYRFIKPNTHDEVDELVEKFNELMDRVEKNYKLQEEFVSNVSHELKTPIANLIGYSKMLERWGHKDEQILKEAIDSIAQTSKQMKELVENMILLSKNLELDMEQINLRTLVEGIVAGYKDIEIKIIGDGTILANKEALEIVIKNLIENAIYHGKAPVEIKLYQDRIEVSDHGEGISNDLRERIFEKFHKSRKSKGHGLGLYIVKKLCDQMGLDIYIKNDKYTTFVVERSEKDEN